MSTAHRSLAAAFGLVAGLAALNASTAIVASRAALGGDDCIDWGRIAPTADLANLISIAV